MNQIAEKQIKKSDNDTDSRQDDNEVNNESNSEQRSSKIPSKYNNTSIKNLQTYFSYLFQQKEPESLKEVHGKAIQHKKDKNIWKTCASINLQILQSMDKNSQEMLNEPITPTIEEILKQSYSDLTAWIFQALQFHPKLIHAKYSPSLIIHKIHSSKNRQIVTLNVQLLYFKTKICILNVPAKNPIKKNIQKSTSGTFGSLYFVKALGQEIAIKLISLEKITDNFIEDINMFIISMASVIEEYFFLTIFSHLQIGPKVKTIGGFDMIVYEDSVIFGTEICEQKLNKETIVQDLSESLMKMHTLRVVHRDIKPLNIMYSPSYKKNVFIDFGCAESLKQCLGQMSQTTFRGTLAFSTVQVLIQRQKKKGYVDLYLNDAYALSKSIQNIQMRQNLLKQDALCAIEINDFDAIQLKYWLYHEAFDNFQELWQKIKLTSDEMFGFMQTQLLKFIPELNFCQQFNLANFYFSYFSQTIRQQPQFHELAHIFSIDDFQAIYPIFRFPEKQEQFKSVKVKYGILSNKFSLKSSKCKQINSVLQNPSSTHLYIEKLQSDWNNNKFFGISIDNMVQSSSSLLIDNVTQMYIICANYCSMSKNKYAVSFEKKIKTITFVMKVLLKTKFIILQEFPFIFKNLVDRQMNQMGQFFQIYALKVSQCIPYELKQSQMVNCLSSLCVIGYVIQDTDDIFCLYKRFIIVSDQQKKILKQKDVNLYLIKKNILIQQGWLICRCFTKRTMFYNRQNFYFDQNLRIPKALIQDECCLASDSLQGNLLCYTITCHISNLKETLRLRRHNITEDFFTEFCRNLLEIKHMHTKYAKKIKREYSQWYLEFDRLWLLIVLNLCLFFQTLYFDGIKPFLFRIQHYFTSQFFQTNQLLYYLTYIQIFHKDKALNAQIFDRADQIINYQKISIRFKLQWRLQIAIKINDFDIIRKVTQILRYDFQSRLISSHSIAKISMIIEIIPHFLVEPEKFQQPLNKGSRQLWINLNDLIKLFFNLGYRYAKQTPNPNYIYKININSIQDHDIGNLNQKRFQDISKMHEENYYVSNYYQLLSRIVVFYQKIFPTFHLNNLHSEPINSISEKFQIDFKEEHFSFIKSLNRDSIVFNYTKKFIQFVKSNEDAKQFIKNSHYLRLALIKQKNNQIDKPMWTQQLQQLFQELSHEQTEGIFGKKKKTTNLFVLFQKMTQQVYESNFDPKLCLQMVKLYKQAKSKSQQPLVFRQRKILHCVLHSFVFSQQNYQEFVELLIDLTRILSCQIKEQYIAYFRRYLSQFFETMNIPEYFRYQFIDVRIVSANFFKMPYPTQWSFDELSQHLIQSLKYLKPETQPYMALVFQANMWRIQQSTKLLKKCIFYILRAMQFLPKQPNNYLRYKMLFHTYYVSSFQLRNQLFQQRGLYLFTAKFPLSQKNQSIHRKTLYTLFKHKTNHHFYQNLNIDLFIQQMHFKQRYFRNYTIPQKFKDLFIKKLRRFILADGRYRIEQENTVFQLIKEKMNLILQGK